MFGRHKLKRIDPSPFSEEVFSLMRGTSTIDQCASLLRQYEKKWGIEHVAPALDTYIEDFTIKTRGPARFKHIVGIPDDDKSWEDFVYGQYFEFLSDTHLILCATPYADLYDTIFSNRFSFQATARAHGDMYAKWANRVALQGKRDWTYVDFYLYTNEKFAEAEAWEKAAYSVMVRKTILEDANVPPP